MRQFQRTIEDFTCEHCGQFVAGNGYTNHCPYCLWSKHVDINPGDRAAACGGLMQPVGVDQKNNEWILIHHCQRCGHEKRNRVAPKDDQAILAQISYELGQKNLAE